MKYLDCVELLVEKKQYAREGVHKGMQGVIWEPERKDGAWVVLFPRYGEKGDIADLYINEADLCLLPDGMDASVNEKIKSQFEDSPDTEKEYGNSDDDLGGYLI